MKSRPKSSPALDREARSYGSHVRGPGNEPRRARGIVPLDENDQLLISTGAALETVTGYFASVAENIASSKS
jgi:hypothetical protein